jgi:hypothetical protein
MHICRPIFTKIADRGNIKFAASPPPQKKYSLAGELQISELQCFNHLNKNTFFQIHFFHQLL